MAHLTKVSPSTTARCERVCLRKGAPWSPLYSLPDSGGRGDNPPADSAPPTTANPAPPTADALTTSAYILTLARPDVGSNIGYVRAAARFGRQGSVTSHPSLARRVGSRQASLAVRGREFGRQLVRQHDRLAPATLPRPN
jgi:hypothetical protein